MEIGHEVAINATALSKTPSGLGIYTRELVRAMLCRDSDLRFRVYSNESIPTGSHHHELSSVHRWTSSDLGYRGHITRMLWYQAVLPRRLQAHRAELFFSPVHEGILFPKVKQILTFHDMIPLKFPQIHRIGKYYYYYAVPLLLKNSQAIVCVSQHSKNDLLAHYDIAREKVYVIHDGCNKELFYPREGDLVQDKYGISRYFVYVGDMRSYKNRDVMLKAYRQARVENSNFVICGKKDRIFYPKIKSAVSRLGLNDRVVFLGYVPDDDLPHLYSQATALVLVSRYEGFGLPALEAMACGCPVVASGTASLPEVCGDAAYYVDPDKADELAEGMRLLAQSPDFRMTLIRRGLERAKQFSWKVCAQEHIALFKHVLSVRTV